MSGVLRWILTRLLVMTVTLFGASLVIFFALRLLPGGYESVVLGPLASEEQRQAAAERWGLDQPLWVQYWEWATGALQGDFGISLISQVPVLDELQLRMPVTGTLALMALAAAVLVGVPLGILTGLRSTRRSGGALGRLAAGLGISIPEFVLGPVVLYVVSVWVSGFGVGSLSRLTEDPVTLVRALILPAGVLAFSCIAVTARTTRDVVMGVLVEPHITAAVARGERPGHIVRHHVLRNSAVPILTLLGTITAYLLGGAVIVETVFNIPGIGSYMITGLGRQDYAVVQASVLLAATLFVVINAALEIAATFVDPRVASRER